MTAAQAYDADLVVAGGGPVGLGTAIIARLAGLDVIVVEPRQGPIDKACGEGLMPGALRALLRLGVDVAGQPFAGIAYVAGNRRAEARFRAGPGRGVRRTALSAALAQRCAALGVRRVEGRVAEIRLDADHVAAAGLRGRWLAAADGLHSPLRRGLGLDVPVAAGPARYGLRRHFATTPWSDLVEVHWARDAEAYVTPVGPDCVGVAVLCSGGAPYEQWLGRFPSLTSRLGEAAVLGPVRGAGPLHQRAARPSAGRVFLVGDAAGYVDALTGEGIAVGLRSAAALVDCLVGGRPEAYDAAWRRASRRYRTLTSGLLWAARRPALRARIVPAAARFPAGYAAVVDALA